MWPPCLSLSPSLDHTYGGHTSIPFKKFWLNLTALQVFLIAILIWLGKKYNFVQKVYLYICMRPNIQCPLEEGTIHGKTLIVKQQVFPESLYTYQFIRSKQQISKHISDSPVYTISVSKQHERVCARVVERFGIKSMYGILPISKEPRRHSSVITANPHVLPFPIWKFLSILLHRILALKYIRTRYSEDYVRGGVVII